MTPRSHFATGRGVKVGSLQLRGKLSVADGTTLLNGSIINDDVSIGSFNRIGKNFSAHGNIRIGNYCAIAQDCFIIANNHRSDLPALQVDFQRRLFPDLQLEIRGNVVIGHNVWLGKAVTVLPNVTIGNGAVIGAGSVVTRDVAPYAVVVGNPARTVKFRFKQDVIEKIESSMWFMKKPAELAGRRWFFSGENYDEFL